MTDSRQTLNEDLGNSVIPIGEGVRWKDYIWELTPIEAKSDGMLYKREDLWALYGVNSLNGSKCRQLLHLFETRPEGVDTVVHATNVNASPQTPMTAAMANHYGLRCVQIAGGTNFKAINRHKFPLFATMFGTEYEIDSGSGFNVNIQKRVREVRKKFPHSFNIERDITLDHLRAENTPEKVEAFHAVGAHQVGNFPDSVEDLILPFGSANSATSVLLGLSRKRPKSLKRIHLVNVGVDKREWMFYRLRLMGADVSMFEIVWHDTEQAYSKTFPGVRIDDITFHPRYEAKVYRYLLEKAPSLMQGSSLFWVIGSVPDLHTTARNAGLEVPTEVRLYRYEPPVEVDVMDLFGA